MMTDTTLNGKSTARHDIIFKAGRSTLSLNTECRVLYVEDNRFNQELAKMMFNRIGCVVDIAANGYEALEMIVRERFDIIFMDINMPRLNGYETTIIIRTKLGLKIPILALTHCDSDEDVRMCKQAGMNDHLKKPLNQKELAHSIMCWRKDRFVAISK
jgi:two-component system, sensor histidine kinase and response regulator